MKSKMILATMMVLLNACIEVRDPNEKKSEPAPVAGPSYEIRPLAHPQRYAVLIKGLSSGSHVVRKSAPNRKAVSLTVENFQVEDVVDEAGPVDYNILQNGTSSELRAEIPRDYVVEGNIILDQKEKDVVIETEGRIYFSAGSLLTTGGRNVIFKATSLHSEGARLQTWPENQMAKMGMGGQHGGNIHFQVQKVEGTLHVIMRGENGGSGEYYYMGLRKDFRSLDNNGKNGGNTGVLSTQILDSSKGHISFDLIPGEAGLGAQILHPSTGKIFKAKGSDGLPGVAQQPMLSN